MEIDILFKDLKLNLQSLVIVSTGGIDFFHNIFNIKPKDFLRYSKLDFDCKCEQRLVNSLSNAKRAIDCQIDETLSKLGIDFEKSIQAGEMLIELFKIDNNLPKKLQIVQALNLAPSFITSNSRNLRNKLEHEYELPTENKVKEIIDIAELFINAVEGKINILESEFIITDEKNYSNNFNSCIKIKFDSVSLQFDVTFIKQREIIESCKLDQSSTSFWFFLRVMISIYDEFECEKTIRNLLKQYFPEIPDHKISLSMKYE